MKHEGVFEPAGVFEEEESRYGFDGIVNAPVFSGSRTFVGSAITYWLFFFPPTTLVLTCVYEIVNFFKYSVPEVDVKRPLVVSGLVLTVFMIWFRAWLHERNTEIALASWADGLERASSPEAERHIVHRSAR